MIPERTGPSKAQPIGNTAGRSKETVLNGIRIGVFIIMIALLALIVVWIYLSTMEVYRPHPEMILRRITEADIIVRNANLSIEATTSDVSVEPTSEIAVHDTNTEPAQHDLSPEGLVANSVSDSNINHIIDQIKQSTSTKLYQTPIGFSDITQFIISTTTASLKANSGTQLSTEWTKISGIVEPVHYRLDLKVNFHGIDTKEYVGQTQSKFSGKVEITIRCATSTNLISLHSSDLKIDFESSSLMKAPQNTYVDIHLFDYDIYNELLNILVKDPLIEQTFYTLTLVFSGDIRKTPPGFFRSDIRDPSTQAQYFMAGTFMLPTYARTVFPCFDEPAMRATFEISIEHPVQYQVVTNMPLARHETQSNELVRDLFDVSPPMSPHMLSILLGSLYSYKSGNIGIYSVALKVDKQAYILKIAPHLLTSFENLLGVNYPLPKLDFGAFPGMRALAMSGWGLITIQKIGMFDRENETRTWEKLDIIHVLSHHIGHQWFGGLVGLSWWNSLWFIEGLSIYMSYQAARSVHATTSMIGYTILVNEVQPAMELDALPGVEPLFNEFNSTQNIQDYIKPLIYKKGCSLVRMMAYMLPGDLFQIALSNFVSKYSYKSATAEDFFDIMTQSQQQMPGRFINFTLAMEAWILNIGFPAINVTREYTRNAVSISQYHFYFGRSGVLPQQHWHIPITYTTASERNFERTVPQFWLTSQELKTNITVIPNDWVIFNIKSLGYYKVNYDEPNWQLIANQLRRDHDVINEMNRAQIVDDSVDFARAGLLPFRTTFLILEYLKNEKSAIVWMSALDSIEKLHTVLHETRANNKWNHFVIDILGNYYNEIIRNQSPDEPMFLSKLRRNFVGVSCYYKLKACVDHSRNYMNKIRANFSYFYTEPVALRSILLCDAIRRGDKIDFYLIFNEYKRMPAATDRNDAIRALLCSHDMKLLQQIMMDNLRDQDVIQIAIATSDKKYGPFLKQTAKSQLKVNKVKTGQYEQAPDAHTEETLDMIADAIFSRMLEKALRASNAMLSVETLRKRILRSSVATKQDWLNRIDQAKIFIPKRQEIAYQVEQAINI